MLRPDPILASAQPDTGLACRVSFGATAAEIRRFGRELTLAVALPVLGGPRTEELLSNVPAPTTRDGCTLYRAGDRLAGFAVAEPNSDLEAAARDLYRRLFAVTKGLRIWRIWNYVPQINAVEHDLENYRRFCRGRSVAFEEHFGQGCQRQMPAASGVGAVAGPLAIAFLAGEAAPHHFENPQQVPAFEYPPNYGPRPPSFSRATFVSNAAQEQLFISGTAAIRGHATIAPHDLAGQLPCTLENLQLIAETAGAGKQLGAVDGWERTFKVYVRRRADFAAVRAFLDRELLREGDAVTYLQADLCRADLLVEIEAVLER
jgi:enamine deaminase RidA (YjgF/YER057c/UK114 family)